MEHPAFPYALSTCHLACELGMYPSNQRLALGRMLDVQDSPGGIVGTLGEAMPGRTERMYALFFCRRAMAGSSAKALPLVDAPEEASSRSAIPAAPEPKTLKDQ